MGSAMGLFSREREQTSSRNQTAPSKWRIASFIDEHEGKKAKKARHVYSLWSAMKYTMILSILLWWLPLFGQMIAGYVGGRKAGSPWRGLIAAILPVAALFAVMTTLDYALSHSFSGNGPASASLLAGFAAGLPIVGPYFDFARDYAMNFISSLTGSSPYGMNSYVITLAFAYIGGILADQTRREIEAVSGAAGSHTTLVVTPNSYEDEPTARRTLIPQVSGFLSGKKSFKPFFGARRRISSFDQMVAENMDGEEIVEADPTRLIGTRDKRHEAKRARKLRAQVHEPAYHTRRPKVYVSSNNPRSLKIAEKRIDREWDPSKRRRAVAQQVIIPKTRAGHHRAVSDEDEIRPRMPRKPVKRSWETI